MARIKDNVLVKGFSGKLDQVVFKTYSYGTVVTRYPDMSKVKLSKAQKKSNHSFKEAVSYAQEVLADPARRKVYEKKLKPGKTVYHAALADFLKNKTKA
jgi:CobQ-like glutamine amidotransferase family enzyme